MKVFEAFRQLVRYVPSPWSPDLISDLLPDAIRLAEVSGDEVLHCKYPFPKPYTKNDGSFLALGTPQLPRVYILYCALVNARQTMEPVELNHFLSMLGNPYKHLETLFETRPLIGIPRSANIKNEAPGEGTATIDWRIVFGETTFLIEVKYRTKPVLQYLEAVVATKGTDFSVESDPESLFKSVYRKFPQTKATTQYCGVWLNVGIKQDADLLIAYFDAELSDRLDFFVISGWDKEGFIYCQNPAIRSALTRCFLLEHVDRFAM